MKKEHVLEQFGQQRIGVDALTVMKLGKQLDIQRQRQHRPGTFAKNRTGDGIVVDVKPVTAGQNVTGHRVHEAEQSLVFQLLVAEPYQRLERDLIAEPMILAQLKDLGVDETLDQTKDIGVGAALDLADVALFIGRQGSERIGQSQPVDEMGKIPQLKNAPKSGAEKSVPEKRTGNAPKSGTSDDAPQKTHRQGWETIGRRAEREGWDQLV